jgi:hypothetical protein
LRASRLNIKQQESHIDKHTSERENNNNNNKKPKTKKKKTKNKKRQRTELAGDATCIT